jgi:hypothetical protein
MGKMTNGDTVTKIRFDLWAVLAFLVFAGISSFTFLYAEGKETKTKQQEVIQRVTVLETQYKHIIEGIDKLTRATENVADKFEQHSKETKSVQSVKKWNDIK